MQIKATCGILIELVIVCQVSLGCQSQGVRAIQPLCREDAPDEVVLGARLDGHADDLGYSYAAANGHFFFYVTTGCEYWVKDGSWATSHGSLSDADVNLTYEALKYLEMPRLAGEWRARACYDASFLRVWASGIEIVCECNCDRSDTPSGVREVERGFEQFVRTMVQRGQPWLGALEILVLEEPTLADQPLIEWPLARELGQFVLSAAALRAKIENDEPVQGILLDDLAEASLVRQAMLEFAQEHPDKIGLGYPLPIQANGSYFSLYARDSLPHLTSMP